ncbi:hypothetical protein Tco_1182967 [Tanacetum coccineum]
MHDLRLLYIAYIADALSGGRMEYGEIKAYSTEPVEEYLQRFLRIFVSSFTLIMRRVERSNATIELESEWSRLRKPVATTATDAGVWSNHIRFTVKNVNREGNKRNCTIIVIVLATDNTHLDSNNKRQRKTE